MIRIRPWLRFNWRKLFSILTVVGGFAFSAGSSLASASASSSTSAAGLGLRCQGVFRHSAETILRAHESESDQTRTEQPLPKLNLPLYYDVDQLNDVMSSLTNERQVRVAALILKRFTPTKLFEMRDGLLLIETELHESAAQALLKQKFAALSLNDLSEFFLGLKEKNQLEALKASLLLTDYRQTVEMQHLLLRARTDLQLALVQSLLKYSRVARMNLIDFEPLLEIQNPRQIDILVAALKTHRYEIAYEMQSALLEAKTLHQARVLRTLLKKLKKEWPTQDVRSLIARVQTETEASEAVSILERDGFDELWRNQDRIFRAR